MILYLLKSTIVLSICLGIYLLFLEREKMHRFNRVYLLGTLIAGLYIPTISFYAPIPSAAIHNKFVDAKSEVNFTLQKPVNSINESYTKSVKAVSSLISPINSSSSNVRYRTPLEYKLTVGLVIAIYMTGFLIVSLNLIFGIYQVSKQLRTGVKIKHNSVTLILLEKEIAPHSFLTFIFLNKEAYDQGRISEQIISHEQSHTRQLHTLDVLLIEFLHILFWFNPLIGFFKRAIKENHEFLADFSVITETKDIAGYQEILLKSVSKAKPRYLSSTLNYRLTKKRLVLLAKRSSKYVMFTKQITVLPLVVLLLFVFGAKKRPGLYESPYKSVLGKEYAVYQFIPGEPYYPDIKLNVKLGPKGIPANIKRKFDNNGDLYTGEQKWYGRENDKLHYIYTYEKGLEKEFRGYNQKGNLLFRQIRTYDGGKEVYRKMFGYNDEVEVLLSYTKRENGLVTRTSLYENGKINREYTVKQNDDYAVFPIIYHGLMTYYDSQGNIVSQNLFDDGKFIEKVK